MSEDNWKHRSEGMKCASCVFFVEKTVLTMPAPLCVQDPNIILQDASEFAESLIKPGKVIQVDVKSILGRCRKHAPTLNGWPTVFSTDWCGDHKIDEEKL